MNLYKIQLKGMIKSFTPCYVFALDPTSAYNAIREVLDNKNIGFDQYREFDWIEQVATDKGRHGEPICLIA